MSSICNLVDQCRESFESLIQSLSAPAQDFGDDLPLSTAEDEFGRFKVWTGNVGAQHDPSKRISLDYRLRDAQFYRDKDFRMLNEMNEILQSGECFAAFRKIFLSRSLLCERGGMLNFVTANSLSRAERLPFDECSSPSEDVPGSDNGADDDSIDSEGEYNVDRSQIASRVPNQFDALRALLNREIGMDQTSNGSSGLQLDDAHQLAPTTREKVPTSEMAQLGQSLKAVVSQLYRIAMVIRRPVPHDRYARSAGIDLAHFEPFDIRYVQDCFPSAAPELQQRLAKGITRRRKLLSYNRRHHQALSRPRLPSYHANGPSEVSQHDESLHLTDAENGAEERPMERNQSQVQLSAPGKSAVGWSTKASSFDPPKNYEDEEADDLDWETRTESSYASTFAGHDQIRIPPRPKNPDGAELSQFECPFCFRIVEIRSPRGWK